MFLSDNYKPQKKVVSTELDIQNQIIAGKCIGGISLGMHVDEVLKKIDRVTNKKEVYNGYILTSGNFMLWFNQETGSLRQILVSGDFKGKFLNNIGIGSTLEEVEKEAGEWREELSVYLLKKYPGICFELKDVDAADDEWDERKIPIECISVFDPDEKISI